MGGFINSILPTPKVPNPVIPPSITDPATTQANIAKEMADNSALPALTKRRGLLATILNGSQGLNNPPNIGRKLLLGD